MRVGPNWSITVGPVQSSVSKRRSPTARECEPPGWRWWETPRQGTLPHLDHRQARRRRDGCLDCPVRLRTLEDGDTDAHLIAPSLPSSPLRYHPLWPAGADVNDYTWEYVKEYGKYDEYNSWVSGLQLPGGRVSK
ncbi:MAG: hypothetical protein M1399_00555 [Actinobacteria bacterium]|nr:hypothetical protein [Actinomycetota bacterium]MCL5447301.1 hypothetical protein [Actinomycetota bacterium]